MPELLIDGVPTNLVLPHGVRAQSCESDVFNICERLKEYDPNMWILVLSGEVDGACFIVLERGPDGIARFVTRVEKLDASLIEECQKMARLDVKERIAELDKQNVRRKAENEERLLNEAVEAAAGPMYDAMYSGGFVHGAKPMSVRPLNPTARRAGRKM